MKLIRQQKEIILLDPEHKIKRTLNKVQIVSGNHLLEIYRLNQLGLVCQLWKVLLKGHLIESITSLVI